MKTRRTYPLAVLLAFGLVVAACGGDVAVTTTAAPTGTAAPTTTEVPTTPIKVGYVVFFSGPAGTYGPDTQRALELRLEQANGEVAGRKIELVFGDEDLLDPAVTLTRVKKLVEQDQVDVLIGPVSGGSQQAVAPYLGLQDILDFEMHAGSEDLLQYGNFITWPGLDTQVAPPAGTYAQDDLGWKTMVTVTPDYIYGNNLMGGAINAFEAAGGEVVKQIRVPLGTTDMLPYASELTDLEADGLMIWLVTQDVVSFLQEAKALGVDLPLFIIHGLYDPFLADFAPEIQGAYGMFDYTWTIDNPTNQEFVSAFQEKYDEAPNHNHHNAYVQMDLLIRALEITNGDTSFEKLREAVISLQIEEPSGPVKFTSEGVALTSRTIAILGDKDPSNGVYRWEPLKTYDYVGE